MHDTGILADCYNLIANDSKRKSPASFPAGLIPYPNWRLLLLAVAEQLQ